MINGEQLRTILWLRWRLTRNQWQRAGGFGAVLALIIGIAAVAMGGLTFAGGLLGGVLGLGQARPVVVMSIWLGTTAAFLFFWLIGLLTELQRSETIDLQRLLHLPVALGQLFVVNYLASHFAVSIIVLLPAMTGLALGLAISRGPAMLLLLPLAWSMVFMISAWTYCLRGWLAAMMTNPRRRRAILMGIPLAFMLIFQLPNIYLNLLGGKQKRLRAPTHGTPEELQRFRLAREDQQQRNLDTLLAVEKIAPPLWLPYGALALAEHRAWPALFGTLGCVALGSLGLHRAYRSTVRLYLGETGGRAGAAAKAPATRPATPPGRAKPMMVERRLPIVPEPAAAVALATFRAMLRAPEVKMAWGTTFLVTVIFGALILSRAAPKVPEVAKPFIATGAMSFSLFMLAQFFANQFGFDRQGFRAFVLSPVDRRLILLGKNLACWPVGALAGLLLLLMFSIWLRLPGTSFVAGVFQLVTLLMLASLGGNLLSILVPFRVEPGSLKATKLPALAMVMMVLCQMLFPVVMLPVLIPVLLELLWQLAGGPVWAPVNLCASGLLAVLAVIFYWRMIGPLGRLLQKRELKILGTVTAERE